MRSKLTALAIAATVAIGAGAFLPTTAGAANIAAGSVAAGLTQTFVDGHAAGNVVEVQHRGMYNRRWHRRHGRHHHRRYHRRPNVYFEFNVPSRRYYEPPPRYYRGRLSPAHYRWCNARYRSYRPYDNTFQPYHGPRQQCLSPYY